LSLSSIPPLLVARIITHGIGADIVVPNDVHCGMDQTGQKLESNGSIGQNRTMPNRDHDARSSRKSAKIESWSRFDVAKTKRGPTGVRVLDIFVPLSLNELENSASGGNALLGLSPRSESERACTYYFAVFSF
jgi:hypothetical protein